MRMAWLPPLGAWLAGAALLCAAALATGHEPLVASTWARSDSVHYEAIARHGYELHHCAPGEGMNARVEWCGDTAWFPGYPLLLAGAAALGLPLEPAGIAISWLAAAATLVLLWRWFLPRRFGPLACAAFAPGVVYLYAIFPLSLLTLAVLVFLRYLDRDERVAGCAGAVAALAYPLGLVLVPVVALVHVWQRRRSRALMRRALVLAGPAVAAGIALLVAQRLQTGRWTAYFDIANSYGGLHDPVTTITDWLTVLRHAANPFDYALVPVWQLLLVTVLLAVAAVATAVTRRGAREAVLLVWCVGVWFVPLVQSHQSLWRSEAALVLLAPLLALLPRALVWTAAAALVVAGYGVAHEFFAGTLI
jgi:hypothetical protein